MVMILKQRRVKFNTLCAYLCFLKKKKFVLFLTGETDCFFFFFEWVEQTLLLHMDQHIVVLKSQCLGQRWHRPCFLSSGVETSPT